AISAPSTAAKAKMTSQTFIESGSKSTPDEELPLEAGHGVLSPQLRLALVPLKSLLDRNPRPGDPRSLTSVAMPTTSGPTCMPRAPRFRDRCNESQNHSKSKNTQYAIKTATG